MLDATKGILILLHALFIAHAPDVANDIITIDGSTGIDTLDKRNRFKRAAKDELTPPKMKNIKVFQDVVQTYDKFVIHGRKFKRQKKNGEM
jgi:hypothetical protein